MEYAEDAGISWRLRYRDLLESIGISCVIPQEEEVELISQDDLRKLKLANPTEYIEVMRGFINMDLNFVTTLDFLIVNWKGERMSGTVHEVGYAYQLGKPSYLVTTKDFHEIPGWFAACFTKIFSNSGELMSFLKEQY